MTQQNDASIRKYPSARFRALALRSALGAAAIVGGSASFLRAEPPVKQDADTIARVDELANAMKHVGKAIEPSVVSIDVEKRAPVRQRMKMDDDFLKRFFPDNDGDGKPDVPEQFKQHMNGGDNSDDNNGDETPDDSSDGKLYGEGSGVILDVNGEDAYILTNNHVAGDATKLQVTLADGRKIEDVTVIGTDPLTDLAVLKVKGKDLVGAKWGESESLEKGDLVLAFGAPFGYVGSMTQGIVSALNRQAGILGQSGYENFIQTDCAINPGNSGGPLVNIHGEIVGINTAIASRSGGFNGIGFAIPSQLAKHVYEQIKDTGKVTRGFLGVKIMDASAVKKQLTKKLGLADDQHGVYVDGFQNDTPAAGKLEPNDVITSIDGQPLKTSQELRFKIATTTPGTTVKLGVIRGGKEQTIDIKVGTLPESDAPAVAKAKHDAATSTPELGVTFADAGANRLKAAGLPEDAKGALVTGVKANSPAAMADLKTNDLIIKVGDKDVTSAAEAVAAIKEGKLSDGISLLIKNKEGTRSIFIQSDGN